MISKKSIYYRKKKEKKKRKEIKEKNKERGTKMLSYMHFGKRFACDETSGICSNLTDDFRMKKNGAKIVTTVPFEKLQARETFYSRIEELYVQFGLYILNYVEVIAHTTNLFRYNRQSEFVQSPVGFADNSASPHFNVEAGGKATLLRKSQKLPLSAPMLVAAPLTSILSSIHHACSSVNTANSTKVRLRRRRHKAQRSVGKDVNYD